MLSDRDLKRLALTHELITPFDLNDFEGATINLRLGQTIRKYISDESIILGKEVFEDDYLEIDLTENDFFLEPGESVLIQTYEFINVPESLSARVYERYSIKSLGLMISPAHYLTPGYRGNIGLLAINHSAVPIRLTPGIKICQIGFFALSSIPLKPYEKQDGKYMDAKDVSISKLHLDKDIQEFLKQKGISRVSDDMAKALGDHLMGHIRESAKRLADTIRYEQDLFA
ncbi:dCTP deaminase [Ferroacidibacillus organovorans]|uniref:Deoxycytidine triphosphate deaminase n=1 Tax=Ferroacidibacillus organovorans TaxID=1765683 RepID=A0A853KAX5_9BACL|nr:dCTP deaminase [Ferroacidibacillus organovorans]KYP81688.1 deoxycytidine triphosphate deaminase [Ferroacidibacillus organovorans]OAG94225.1 deoxycytidine triphosphate deaminase [Ferroacidibacillus organovorans]